MLLNLKKVKHISLANQDSTNSGHTLAFSTTVDGTHGSGEYTSGVTYNGTTGNPGAFTQITVRKSTAKLYIYCKAHAQYVQL